jgi:hypothetical protein
MSTRTSGYRFLLAAAFAVVALAALPQARAADDIATMFQMGKAAYYRGDLELAHQLLTQVEQRDPRHFETRALLAQIRTGLKSDGGLKRTYEGVTLTKVDFADLTLSEALDGLRILSKNASGGKVIPNFIVQDQTLNDKNVSLQLHNLPLTEAISYLAKVTGSRVVYEKHAVLFTNAAGGGAPAPTPAPETTGKASGS